MPARRLRRNGIIFGWDMHNETQLKHATMAEKTALEDRIRKAMRKALCPHLPDNDDEEGEGPEEATATDAAEAE